MPNGKYIVIDGVAPAKSMMVEMLAHQLEAIELPAHIIDGQDIQSDAGAQALQQVLHRPEYPLHSRTEALLYNAIRSQLAEVVSKTRGEGKICISTEGYLSTLVNQYYGRGDITDYAAANTVVQFATGNIQPDLLLILDTVNNTAEKQQTPKEQALFERLRAGYLWEAQQRRLPVIYATDDLDATFKQVWAYIAQTLSISPTVPVPTAMVRSAKKQAATSGAAMPTVATSKLAAPAQEPTATLTVPKPPTIPPVQMSIAASEALGTPLTSEDWQRAISRTPYERKDEQEHYRYYIPEPLKGKLRSQYIRTMNQHFAHYAELFDVLTNHLRSTAGTPKAKRDQGWEDRLALEVRRILAPLVPLAATLTVSQLTPPPELDQQDSLPNDQSLTALAEQYLPPGYAVAASPVSLIDYYPRNELDTAADILYTHADLPLRALKEAVTSWPYDRKAAVVSSSSAFATRYSFEILSDYHQFRSLHGAYPDHVSHQPLNPRYGYVTPPAIEEAGLSDAFDDCFDRSLQLYSALQAEHPRLAAYAALLGHQMRWRFDCAASDLKRLRVPQGLAKELVEKVGEVHPLTYGALSGSNKAPVAPSEHTSIS
jgi:thymidylate kinase